MTPASETQLLASQEIARVIESAAIMQAQRQKVLILYLASSALDTPVVAWSLYDGTGKTRTMAADSDEPPYTTGLHALKDGWRLIQLSQLIPPYPGEEFSVSYQRYECVFEKLEPVSGDPDD